MSGMAQQAQAPQPAATPANRHTDLSKLPIGIDVKNALFGGIQPLATADGSGGQWWMADVGVNESGSAVPTPMMNDGAQNRLEGYTYDWAPTGKRNEGWLTAYKPDGTQAGRYWQSDPSASQGMLEAGGLALAGFGGIGALTGLGPLGFLGGGAAGQNSGLMGPPAEAAGGLMGPPVEAAGAGAIDAGAGAGAAATAGGEGGIGYAAAAEGTDPFVFNAAKDSAAVGSSGAAIPPAGVNLGSAGGIGATSGALAGLGQIGDAIYGGLAGVGTALKNNPGLAAAGASLLAPMLNGSGGSAPSPTSGAAGAASTIDQQKSANMEQAMLQAALNRVDTVNPYGSTRYNAIDDPSVPGGKRYEQVTSLSPGQQQLFDANQSSQIGQAQLLDALTKRLQGDYASGADFSGVPELQTSAGNPEQYNQQAADAMYSRAMRYLEPEQAQARSDMEARLAEQGFVPGTPAYERALQTISDSQSRARADARDSSLLQGLAAGQNLFSNNLANAQLNNTASGQSLAQLLQKRAQPLNELNAVRSGSQVQVPSANAPSPISINGVDVAGINNQAYQQQLDAYNANVGSKNAQNASLSQLGTALLQYFSDARLKDDITLIGQTPGGANLYHYTIFGRPEIGVLAQELLVTQPAAVSVHESGFFIVDYSKVR